MFWVSGMWMLKFAVISKCKTFFGLNHSYVQPHGKWDTFLEVARVSHVLSNAHPKANDDLWNTSSWRQSTSKKETESSDVKHKEEEKLGGVSSNSPQPKQGFLKSVWILWTFLSLQTQPRFRCDVKIRIQSPEMEASFFSPGRMVIAHWIGKKIRSKGDKSRRILAKMKKKMSVKQIVNRIQSPSNSQTSHLVTREVLFGKWGFCSLEFQTLHFKILWTLNGENLDPQGVWTKALTFEIGWSPWGLVTMDSIWSRVIVLMGRGFRDAELCSGGFLLEDWSD